MLFCFSLTKSDEPEYMHVLSDLSKQHGIAGKLLVVTMWRSFAAPYVKVYLLENGACIAKKKTKVARKTLDPLYQQQLSFEENPGGKVLQVQSTGH